MFTNIYAHMHTYVRTHIHMHAHTHVYILDAKDSGFRYKFNHFILLDCFLDLVEGKANIYIKV